MHVVALRLEKPRVQRERLLQTTRVSESAYHSHAPASPRFDLTDQILCSADVFFSDLRLFSSLSYLLLLSAQKRRFAHVRTLFSAHISIVAL